MTDVVKKCLRISGYENLHEDDRPYAVRGPITAIPLDGGDWVLSAEAGVRWHGEHGPAERESWRRAFGRLSPLTYHYLLGGTVAAILAALYLVLQLITATAADLVDVAVQAVVIAGAGLALWAGWSAAATLSEPERRLTDAGRADVAAAIAAGRRTPTVDGRAAATVLMMYDEGFDDRAITLVDALEAPRTIDGEPSSAWCYAQAEMDAWWERVEDRRLRDLARAAEAAAAARRREEDQWRARMDDR